jgi:hypothetical protein
MTDAADSELDGIARRRLFSEWKHFFPNLRWRGQRGLGSSEGGKSGNHACDRDIAEKIAARNRRVSHESTRDERFVCGVEKRRSEKRHM